MSKAGDGQQADVEVVVAGGGVGGTLIARDLARAGHEVLVLERRARGAVGHDWWDSVDARVFDEVGLDRPTLPERAVGGFQFLVRGPDGSAYTPNIMPPETLNVDRKRLAQRLLGEAEAAGATIRDRTAVRSPLIEGGRVVGLMTRSRGRDEPLRARLTVDATGVDAVLRAHMPGGLGFRRHLRPGEVFRTYREIRRDTAPGKRSIVVVGEEGGAQWLSRQPDGLVDLFAGCPDEPGRGNPRQLLAELVRTEGGVSDELVRGGQGARIPIRRAFDSFVAPGFLLVGDAACMANPLNGSGIGSTLRAARFAAAAAHRALSQGRVDPETLWSYNAAYQRGQGASFAKLHLLQAVLLDENVHAVHALLQRRILPPDSLWTMDQQFTPRGLARRLPRMVAGALTMPHHPGFLSRLGMAIGLMLRTEACYKAYPEHFDPSTFARWQRRRQRLDTAFTRALRLLHSFGGSTHKAAA